MASKREQVVAAILALVTTALPNASVRRNPAKASSVGAGGSVDLRDGDPGEPDVLLSPVTYCYEHRIPLELAPYASASRTPEEVLDEMLTAVGAAVDADPTLGGLCTDLRCEAPALDDLDVLGSEAGAWAEAAIIAAYDTPRPL